MLFRHSVALLFVFALIGWDASGDPSSKRRRNSSKVATPVKKRATPVASPAVEEQPAQKRLRSKKSSNAVKQSQSVEADEYLEPDEPLKFVMGFHFIRERMNFAATGGTIIEPLFNNLYFVEVGAEWTKKFGRFKLVVPGGLLLGASKMGNASADPTFTVNQSVSFAGGVFSKPEMRFVILNKKSFSFESGIVLPIFARLQAFATSPEGTIDFKAFRVLYGVGGSLRFQKRGGYFVQIDWSQISLTKVLPTLGFSTGTNF